MQIVQLTFGAIALPFFYNCVETQQNKRVICIFDAYIVCLLFLFGKFMLENYFCKEPRLTICVKPSLKAIQKIFDSEEEFSAKLSKPKVS
jgi:hypothetical protein